MEAHYKETFSTWNAIAKLYEAHFMDLEIYNTSYQYFLDLLPMNAEVLEVGCGPGNITRYCLRQRPDLSILGTDISENMVALAAKNNPTAKFQTLDTRHIKDLKRTFEGLISGFCIPYLNTEDLHAFLKNSFDILAPHGFLYLSFVAGDYEDSKFLSGSTGQRTYFYYHPLESVLETLNTIGFQVKEILDIPYKKSDGTSEIHTILLAET